MRHARTLASNERWKCRYIFKWGRVFGANPTNEKETNMMGIMVETVVIAFVMGGIIGAVTALHLSTSGKGAMVRIDSERPGRRRIR